GPTRHPVPACRSASAGRVPVTNRRTATMEIQEVVRLLRTAASDRTVSEALALTRRTVAKYRGWAARDGLLAPATGLLPAAGELERRLCLAFPSAVPPQQTSRRSKRAPRQAAGVAHRDRGPTGARHHPGAPVGALPRRGAGGARAVTGHAVRRGDV